MRRLYLNRLDAEECGGLAVESQICYETKKGQLEKHDIGTPVWVAAEDSKPALLIGINTATRDDCGLHVALFTDLSDPKVRDFIMQIKGDDEKPKKGLGRLFG